MRATAKTCMVRHGAAFLAAGALAVAPAACGDDDFEREPRPAVPVELTGVIQDDKVTVSPNEVGAGPVLIIISNQTEEAHTITLEGGSVNERVGPVNPLDTATIQKTLPRGTYQVRAGSEAATPKEIEPAVLRVGAKREDSNDRLLLP